MNKDGIPFQGQHQELTENQEHKEKVPWKLGRHVKPEHVEILNKLAKDYKQHMQLLLNLQNDKGSRSHPNKNIH